MTASVREHLLVVLGAAAVTALLIWPLARHPGSVARVDSSDGQFSIWNVNWVARTVVADPIHLFDANIFHPHRGTLLYSEANLAAGLFAVPGYWLTRNPYFAHNSVVLLAFFLSAVATYWLVRYLTGNPWASAVAGICFAFCPHVFAHTTHIQLLMTPGIPFSMLAFHHLADRPTNGRAALLGLAIAFTVYSCAYYGIFVVLMIGFSVLFIASVRRWWTDGTYWSAILVAAGVAALLVLPLFIPYAIREGTGGFDRSLNEARRYSGDWRAYLASAATAHAWLIPIVKRWSDVAFPGFVALLLGVARVVTARHLKGRTGETVALYACITALAYWISLGPDAGLYRVFYTVMPGFSLMRAPVRFALVVVFGLSVLAGFSIQALCARVRRGAFIGVLFVVLALADHWFVLDRLFPPVRPLSPAYATLARVERAPLIELPFFEQPSFFPRHTVYMMLSTHHWLPLVNGYSDYFPDGFQDTAVALAPFPFPGAFHKAKELGVRYALIHLNGYDERTRAEVEARLTEFAGYLKPLYEDADTRLYEIVGTPD